MTRYGPHWKRRLLKIPQNIRDKVARLKQDTCVIACSIRIPKRSIQGGVYKHIGIVWNDGVAVFPHKIVPHPDNGPFSRANIEGKVIVHEDKPKVLKTYSMDTPNFGDWSKGTHEVDFQREVYQREYIPPKELAIRIGQIAEDVGEQSYVFSFTVDDVLDRTAANFEQQLFFNLNLLQENVGNHGVFPSDTTREDFIRTLYVNWEILPPDERDTNIDKIFRTVGSADPKVRARIQDRYDTLARFKPIQFVQGTSEFRHYFGAQFADDLVVFENIEYGNALYVMFENWQTLSQKSRTELLTLNPDEVVRIPHTKTWKIRLRALIMRERAKRRRQAN